MHSQKEKIRQFDESRAHNFRVITKGNYDRNFDYSVLPSDYMPGFKKVELFHVAIFFATAESVLYSHLL